MKEPKMKFHLYKNYALNSEQEIESSSEKEDLITKAKQEAKADPDSRFEVIRFEEDGEAVSVYDSAY